MNLWPRRTPAENRERQRQNARYQEAIRRLPHPLGRPSEAPFRPGDTVNYLADPVGYKVWFLGTVKEMRGDFVTVEDRYMDGSPRETRLHRDRVKLYEP